MKWLDEFKSSRLGKENYPYLLTLDLIPDDKEDGFRYSNSVIHTLLKVTIIIVTNKSITRTTLLLKTRSKKSLTINL